MARTLSIFDLWGDMIANPTKYGNSAMREARAKQLENIQNSEASLIDNTYRVANMHRQLFANRYASNITNNYYRWIAGGGTPDSFFKAQFAAIDADPAISGVDQETRAMIYGNLQQLANNIAYNLYGVGQKDAADALLRSVSGYGVPERYKPNWQTEQLMNLYNQGQQGQNVDLASLYQTEGVDYRTFNGQQFPIVKDNWESLRNTSAQEQAAQSQQDAKQNTAQQATQKQKELMALHDQISGMSDADLASFNAKVTAYLNALSSETARKEAMDTQLQRQAIRQQQARRSLVGGDVAGYNVAPAGVLGNNTQQLENTQAQLAALKKQEAELQEEVNRLLLMQQAGQGVVNKRYPVGVY